MKKAIVVCSGGLDSVTTAYYVKKRLRYNEIIVLFFNYGQRSLNAERKYAKKCSVKLRAGFCEVKLEYLGKISTSLVNNLGKHKSVKIKNLKNSKKESEKWYVPCRNLVFLSNALALAESIQIKEKIKADIFVGFKNEGQEYYPDTTQFFLDSLNNVSKVSTLGKYKIKAPLIKMDKEDIILLARELNVNFKDTFSCYSKSGGHCGTCLACRLRQEGFYWANIKDPTNYKKKLKDFRLS